MDLAPQTSHFHGDIHTYQHTCSCVIKTEDHKMLVILTMFRKYRFFSVLFYFDVVEPHYL
jgi:hypothetical protein